MLARRGEAAAAERGASGGSRGAGGPGGPGEPGGPGSGGRTEGGFAGRGPTLASSPALGASAAAWWDWSGLLARLHADLGSVRLADRFDTATEVTGRGRLHVLRPAPAAGWDAACVPPRLPPPGAARAALLSRLELVHGVGPVTAAALRAAGTRSVEDLVGTGRHGPGAAEVCAEWEAGDLAAVGERLQRRLAGRGHMLAALLAACADPSEIAFLDVETLGLGGNVVFLCGVARVGDGELRVEQYLAPGYADEPAMLERVLRALGDARVVVTYNGRTADLVWLRSRCFYHGLAEVPGVAHVDLVFGTRRRFVHDEPVLGDARLGTVQKDLLGVPRPAHDVPSAAVPEIYQEYARTGCEGLLVPVLDHNVSDLLALVALLGRMCDEALAWCA